MIIAVDFDGTIHDGNYPYIGALRDDVREVISELRQDGHYIIIWTCRNNEDLDQAISYLIENNIEFDRINDNHPYNIDLYNSNCRKVYADVYVDDRQIGQLPSWREIKQYIDKLK